MTSHWALSLRTSRASSSGSGKSDYELDRLTDIGHLSANILSARQIKNAASIQGDDAGAALDTVGRFLAFPGIPVGAIDTPEAS